MSSICLQFAASARHDAFIAGFGHIALGLTAGRLFAESHRLDRPMGALLAFPLLALLPDLDFVPVALGLPDRGALGHRGFTHTPLFAIGVGVLTWASLRIGGWLRPRRWPSSTVSVRPATLALAVALAVASHAVLDALAQGGRGMLFLWPFSEQRFHFPWRPIPDNPIGFAFFSEAGWRVLRIEFGYFLPFSVYALWPRKAIRQRSSSRSTRATPQVT